MTHAHLEKHQLSWTENSGCIASLQPMFLLTEIRRFQSLTVVAHNVDETAVDGHEGGVDVGRGCEDNVKTGFAPGRNCDLRQGQIGNGLAKFRLEDGIQPDPVDWVHSHTGRPGLVTDGVRDWPRTGVGDSYGVFAVEVICVI